MCNTSNLVSFTSFFYRFSLLVCSLSFIRIVCPSNSVPANINISYLVLEEILQMILSYLLIFYTRTEILMHNMNSFKFLHGIGGKAKILIC